jgi:hypothetical protein
MSIEKADWPRVVDTCPANYLEPKYLGKNLLDRLMAKVEVNPETGCWEWTALRTPGGYGKIGLAGKYLSTHRVAYELFAGPIPEGEGLHLHHHCGNRACCRPDHLALVTPKEHKQEHWVTHCSRGHELSGDNLYIAPNGDRHCRTYMRERNSVYYAAYSATHREELNAKTRARRALETPEQHEVRLERQREYARARRDEINARRREARARKRVERLAAKPSVPAVSPPFPTASPRGIAPVLAADNPRGARLAY